MALSPAFTVGQVEGSPADLYFEDTSTGSDGAITARQIFLITDNGAYIVPSGTTTNFIDWILASTQLTVSDVLNKDYSLQVTTNWIDVNDTVLYTVSQDVNFNMYNQLYNYSLVSDEANGLASLNSPNWLRARMALYLSLNDSDTSVTDMSSITNGQNANDRGTYIRLNPQTLY